MATEIFFDGSFKNGKMGIGYVVFKDGVRVFSYSCFFNQHPQNTNNISEHLACNQLLRYLCNSCDTDEEIYVYGDSALVVNQMSGKWKVGISNHSHWALNSLEMVSKFANIHFFWIPRSSNGEADRLTQIDGMPIYFEDIIPFTKEYLNISLDFNIPIVALQEQEITTKNKRKKHRYYNPTVKQKIRQ